MTKFGGKKHILVEFTSIHPSLAVKYKLEGQKWPHNFFSVNIFALNLPVNSVSSTLCARLCLMGGTFIYLFIYSNNHIIYRNIQICNFIFSKKKIVKENKKSLTIFLNILFSTCNL
jgi:hypothetical protein